jgi:galactokinase
VPPAELAALCQRAEHDYAGVPSGIMDQFASILSRPGAAMLLDCRTRQIEFVPCAMPGHGLLVVDSGVRHELAAGEYAARRRQCERVVELVRTRRPDVTALRDLTVQDVADLALDEQLAAAAGSEWPILMARARHVVSENERTRAAASALRRDSVDELGRLMNASHLSLRDDYEVSCPELDELVALLGGTPGVRGARMTGGGFGGSVVALVEHAAETGVAERLRGGGSAGRFPGFLWVQPGPGAESWPVG